VAVLERKLGIDPLPETRAAYQAVLDEHKPSTLSVMGEQKEELSTCPVKRCRSLGESWQCILYRVEYPALSSVTVKTKHIAFS
jgi:hypothetical protein